MVDNLHTTALSETVRTDSISDRKKKKKKGVVQKCYSVVTNYNQLKMTAPERFLRFVYKILKKF